MHDAIELVPVRATPHLGLPARAVEKAVEVDQVASISGLHLIQVQATLLASEIEAGDCIEVDFDRRAVAYDGLYLVEIDQGDGGRWHCARRFQHIPGENGIELWGCNVSAERWARVPAEMLSRITIHGEIREVFKPTSKRRQTGEGTNCHPH
ncbi:hypothetical protein C8238_08355 [Paracidovorax avenae]|uniref:hypothetical protein n=1 Tax=Paracidovorax avenae TaxID=80867 RepID=UPI000D169DE8|nr:hypothetical protein [Paracidovorax avenae]AVS88241.1 hypothetical protein C8238_08355 [Paracidovorax avenae]